MKSLLALPHKLFTVCMAIGITFALGLGTARAQEMTVDGSTTNSTFTGSCEGGNLEGLSFAGTNFGGTTTNGVLDISTPNNNLGTIHINPAEATDPCGSLNLNVLFNLPGGFDTNPIIGAATVFGGNGVVIPDFDNNPKTVAFPGGSFSVVLADGCYPADHTWCTGRGDGQLTKLRRLRGPVDSVAFLKAGQGGGGDVRWLKTKGASSMSAVRPMLRSIPSYQTTVAITLRATITLTPGTTLANACTRGQGYYKSQTNAIPNFVTTSDSSVAPFMLRLGTNGYTKSQLLQIYRTPVKMNGLIALAHQLITAKLNAAGGGVPASVGQAINQADALIGNMHIPPVNNGNGYLSPAQTSALTDFLTDYNEGRIAGAPRCQ